MMSRRGFFGSMVAACALAVPGSEEPCTRVGRGLARPEGRVFEGMCGAYAAMYTPFFRSGRQAGELNEAMVERLVEYAVSSSCCCPIRTDPPTRA